MTDKPFTVIVEYINSTDHYIENVVQYQFTELRLYVETENGDRYWFMNRNIIGFSIPVLIDVDVD